MLCLKRTLATAVHETGHMLGIKHCTLYECGMNGSNNLRESDSRPFEFCPECQQKILLMCGVEPKNRYHKLLESANTHGHDEEAQYWRKAIERVDERRGESAAMAESAPKPSGLLIAQAAVSIFGILILIATTVPSMISPSTATPYEFIGAVIFSPLLIAIGAGILVSVVRRSLVVTQAITLVYFGLAIFVAFGVIANLVEAFALHSPVEMKFVGLLLGVGFTVGLFFFTSGLVFSHWGKRLAAASRNARRTERA